MPLTYLKTFSVSAELFLQLFEQGNEIAVRVLEGVPKGARLVGLAQTSAPTTIHFTVMHESFTEAGNVDVAFQRLKWTEQDS